MDNRRFHRVVHDARATVFGPGRDWPCQLHDLSLKGCLLEAGTDWQLDPEQTYRVSIWLALDIEIGWTPGRSISTAAMPDSDASASTSRARPSCVGCWI